MNTIIRHIFTAVLFSLLTAVVVLAVAFAAFPPDDWSVLWTREISGVPFLAIVIGIPILLGIVIGTTTGWYWLQRLHRIDRHLDDLIKGQRLSMDDESYKEIKVIQQRFEQIQNKFQSMADHAQRLATNRANEREKSLQEVVVQERNRLARELHDSVSQQLFAASMMMSAINEAKQENDSPTNKQLQMVEKMIHQSQLEMRALLLHLRPVALKGKSLQEGVEELLLELMQKVPMKIEWKVEEFQVDKGIEDQLFRILQEAVSNTLRHAKATSLHVMLIERDDTIILRVVDNGIGFDVEKAKTSSYGLVNMQERAFEVGGVCKIISLPNQGARLEVKVPQLRKDGDHD